MKPFKKLRDIEKGFARLNSKLNAYIPESASGLDVDKRGKFTYKKPKKVEKGIINWLST